jgi:hypothetical protein
MNAAGRVRELQFNYVERQWTNAMELNGAEAEDERHEGSNSEKVKQSYCES